MRRSALFTIVALGLLAPMVKSADAPLPLDVMVGSRISDFTLQDAVTKNDVRLYGFVGKKALVLVFMGVDCPVGNLYVPRLVELNEKYKDKGVVFVGINSNKSEMVEKIADHAKAMKINFPVLRDKDNLVADMLQAQRTNEVLILNRFAFVQYRGAIDNQYTQTAKKDNPTENYLVDALEVVLADAGGRPDQLPKDLKVKGTEVAGCPIERGDVALKLPDSRLHGPTAEIQAELAKRDGKIEVGKVNYAEHVASILQNKCQECHRPGQAAPFSLLTYDDARRWAASIGEVVEERRMPPWHADPRYGHFANDRSLSGKDRATLMAWVEQGTPLGDPAKLPAAKTFTEGWTIGKPDVVFEIPENYHVPRQGTVEYVHYQVPTNFTEDMWIQAAEARPTDRAVVHHIIVFVVEPSKPGDPRGGGRRNLMHFCGYAPGDMPTIMAPGVARKIPAGSTLVFEIHYTPDGKPGHVDRSKVGLIFAKQPPKYEAYITGVMNNRFVIPRYASNHEVISKYTFPADVTLFSLLPHMHLRGKSFKYILVEGGKEEVLLDVPVYDFAWQTYYTLAQPRVVKAGSTLKCVAHFDNSEKNLANPNPGQGVRWGEQTYEEMMIGYVEFFYNKPVGEGPREKVPPLISDPIPNEEVSVVDKAVRTMLQGARRPAAQPAPTPAPAPAPAAKPNESRN